MEKRRFVYLLSILFVALPFVVFASVPLKTSYPVLGSIENMNPNGEFGIYVYQSGKWLEVERLSFDMYLRERTVDLGQYLTNQSELKVRLVQRGGGAAHIDSVFMDGISPKSADHLKGKESLKKLGKKDFDVIDAYGKTIDFIFSSKVQGKNLSVTARIESEKISKIPFQFPRTNFYRKIDRNAAFYAYRLKQATTDKPESGKPFFVEFSRSGSGHPYGYTYGWVWNDENYMYVKLDFTTDNTMDGLKDWAKVYVNTEKELKEFKISMNDTKWGSSGFTYTDKVDYEHKVYHFKIPLKEIMPTENQILLAFALYGTAALPPLFLIEITMKPDTQTVNAGEKAKFTITVTNTSRFRRLLGNSILNNRLPTLFNINVSDPLTPDCARSIPDLATGESFAYKCMTDALSSGFTNVATVTAHFLPNNNFNTVRFNLTVTDTDTATVKVNNPELEISKKAYRKDIFAGETATFRIEVRNPSAVTLTDIVISDPLTPDCEHRLRQLLPGEKVSYKCETEPLFEDLTNVVTVTARSPNGEIEESDKEFVNIQIFDWGDAPQGTPLNPLYSTLFTRDGARHKIKKIPELYLGLGVDSDPDGQPNIDATGDDNDGNDDEDGVVFNTPLIADQQARITVTAFDKGVLPGFLAGLLDAWIDYNDDGDWDDPGEQIFDNKPLGVGNNPLTFTVPANAVTDSPTYARFRFSSKGVLLPYRAAPDGEVEDYRVNIQNQ